MAVEDTKLHYVGQMTRMGEIRVYIILMEESIWKNYAWKPKKEAGGQQKNRN
jgi:hypothetical protein